MGNDFDFTAAVIGIGRIGMLLEDDPKRKKPGTHFGMWELNPRVDLVAVSDTNPDNLAIAKSKRTAIQTYANPEKMLEEVQPDIVSIATWKDTHYEMMKLCLKHGVKAIVCEKPIAEKNEDAREVVEEARSKSVHLFINHRRRFDELLYPLRRELEEGFIGEIIQVQVLYVYGLVTTGTHVIDTLRFFLKDIAGEVRWVIGLENPFRHFSPGDDPCIDGWIGFENGLKVSIQSLDIKDYDIFDYYIYGRKGKAIYKNIGRDIEIYKVIESPEHKGFTELSFQPTERRGGEPRDQFGFLANHVLDCLEGKATSLSTGEDSLRALEILNAMKESASNKGMKIEI
jgi:predicted dehydrogenase